MERKGFPASTFLTASRAPARAADGPQSPNASTVVRPGTAVHPIPRAGPAEAGLAQSALDLAVRYGTLARVTQTLQFGRARGLLVVLALALAPARTAPAGTPAADLTIEARLQVREGRIRGTATLAFRNSATHDLAEIRLWAYPNRYNTDGRKVPHDLFDRVFPAGPSPARLEFGPVLADGLPAEIAGAAGGPPDGVLVNARLPRPLPPGGTVTLVIPFETRIPERFGSFGRHGKSIVLNGGWHPYPAVLNPDGSWNERAPPPRLAYRVRVELEDRPGHLFLNGGDGPLRPAGSAVEAAFSARLLTLVYYDTAFEVRTDRGGIPLAYAAPRHRPESADELARGVEHAVGELRAAYPNLRIPPFLFLEAPLRRDLVLPGEGAILLSDRFREVTAPAREYHLGPVIEAVYHRIFLENFPPAEAADFGWEAEAAAWWASKAYWKIHRRRYASLDDYLRPFGFIRAVDDFRMAPRFPFTGAFLGDPYEADPLREDVLRFNRHSAHGRILAEKLRNLLGEEGVRRSLDSALRGEGRLADRAEAEAGRPLADFLAQWTEPYPRVNYKLAGWRRERTDGGAVRSVITLRQEGAPVDEPVTVEVRRWFGPSKRAVWSGEGDEGVLAIETERRPHRVVLDPDRRLKETTRVDNAFPPGVKVLLEAIKLGLNFNDRDHEFSVIGSVIVGNNYRRRYWFDAHSREEGDGYEIQYIHSFGRPFDPIRFRREATVGYLHTALSPSFAKPESGLENDPGRIAGIKSSFELRTTESRRNRLDGMTALLEGEYGDAWLGSDYRYWKTKLTAQGVVPILRDRHLLALRGNAGASDEDGTPTQVLFDAGGWDAVRGINTGLILGNYRWLTAAEYRWIVRREIGAGVLSLFWLRSVQTALYVDVGNVSPDPNGLLDGDRIHSGAGVGLRLHLDLLGISPTVVRLDAARRIDADSGDDRPMYYIGVGQSF